MKAPHVFLTGNPGVGKTTIVKKLQASVSGVITKGFYTQECRAGGGDRIGFDILYWTNASKEPKRVALSRVTTNKVKKGDPCVGKYLVNVDNIEKYCMESLKNSYNSNNKDKELMIIDEVGKMEMKCKGFVPTVMDVLDTNHNSRIVVGTIPTPRYGHVIQAIEDIRARDDVLVLHVTKSNRDELSAVLEQSFQDLFSQNQVDLWKVLEPYIYSRPIGASSMNRDGNSNRAKASLLSTEGGDKFTQTPPIAKPCGYLISKNIKPKVLILGETASPLPSCNPEYACCERSMWIILGKIFNIDYKPIKDIETAGEKDLELYQRLKQLVLSQGICVWDVLANVHVREKKKKRRAIEDTPNDLHNFLKKYPSIKVIAFIGQKAHATFTKFNSNIPERVGLVTLPSSSPANSRMSTDEKADVWKQEISKGYSSHEWSKMF